MIKRFRTLRTTSAVRDLVAETVLTPADFIAPVFIEKGKRQKIPIPSMPGYFRYSIDEALVEVKNLWSLGIKSILLFIKCDDALKDNEGREACNDAGLMQQAVRAIKNALPDMYVMTDIALDPYSIHGHDGVVQDGRILNDETVEVLARMSVSHAAAGADMVAPSDMMDGRVEAIRKALDDAGYINTGIMSYSAKYASCFYGPFRDALDSAPGFGDKKTYQMDFRNRKEALKETLQDVAEGADIVMVKPGMAYLDIVREVVHAVQVPLSVYQVSGEYAMVKAAAAQGWINEDQAVIETLTAFKRAGASLIATYYAAHAAKILRYNL